MKQDKVHKWLKDREIVLGESFTQSLRSYVECYSKENDVRLGKVYELLDIRHQYMSRWSANKNSTLTKNRLKYRVILRASELFYLTDCEAELMANRAGLSLEFVRPKITMNRASNQKWETARELSPRRATAGDVQESADFIECFEVLLRTYPKRVVDLCNLASVSERMFRHIKNGRHLKKEPILALLIAMNCPLNSIQDCLKRAGFILSKSMPADVVVLWVLENERCLSNKIGPIYQINETLDSLGLPLLMTRARGDTKPVATP